MARRVNMRELYSTGGVSVNAYQEGFSLGFFSKAPFCFRDSVSTKSDYSRNDDANAPDVRAGLQDNGL